MEIAPTNCRRRHGSVFQGRFDAASAPEAEGVFKKLAQEGAVRVAVDLSGVEYISSGGLRVVIMLSKSLEREAPDGIALQPESSCLQGLRNHQSVQTFNPPNHNKAIDMAHSHSNYKN